MGWGGSLSPVLPPPTTPSLCAVLTLPLAQHTRLWWRPPSCSVSTFHLLPAPCPQSQTLYLRPVQTGPPTKNASPPPSSSQLLLIVRT